MRRRALLLIALLPGAMTALAQPGQAPTRPSLASILNVPEHQWALHHACVPLQLPGVAGYTNADYINAYLDVSKSRWDASIAALEVGDEKRSMASLTLIIHGVVDLYWPDRVVRDPSGAITHFRDCDALGNLPGILREETAGTGPSGSAREEAIDHLAEIIRKWKQRRAFQEVADILSSGPMRLSNAHSGKSLGQKQP